MQGRITKVLNMKPPEILGMIEEAAGTRMFEMKKQNALKTIQKKEKKLEEIQKVIDEEITPTLDKLTKEKSAYIKWSQNNAEKEQLQRFVIAFQYTQKMDLKMNGDKIIKETQNEVEQMTENIELCDQEISSLEQKIKKIKDNKKKVRNTVFSCTDLFSNTKMHSKDWKNMLVNYQKV